MPTRRAMRPPVKRGRSNENLVLEPVLKINSTPRPRPRRNRRAAPPVPLKSGRFVAIDLDRGTIRWAVDLVTTQPAAVSNGPCGRAPATSCSRGLDAKTGAARWKVPGDRRLLGAAACRQRLGHCRGHRRRCVDAPGLGRQVLWTKALGASVRARPAIAADAAYSLENGHVVSVELLTGEPRWDRALPGKTRRPAGARRPPVRRRRGQVVLLPQYEERR